MTTTILNKVQWQEPYVVKHKTTLIDHMYREIVTITTT